MALRNLNREYSRGRICGTRKSGVLGSAIPPSGDNGAGYAYSSLSLPADNDKEYQGYITSAPSGLNIYAYEDTSFTASANDGTYEVPWELYENGVYLGSTTFTLTFGNGVIISCSVGNASASSALATINQEVVISSATGNASADGSASGIDQGYTVSSSVGNVSADGQTASVFLGVSINADKGDATADGSTATILQGLTIACTVGNSTANGSTATISLQSAYTLSTDRTVTLTKKQRVVLDGKSRIVEA